MAPKTFMLIAGEASGDLIAAELVSALRGRLYALDPHAASPPKFFGAGGQKMADAEVELAFDMTEHAVIGISDVLKNYFKFRRLFDQLLALAIERKPDVVIGVDFGGFNLRFGHAVREYVRNNPFSNWNPKIVQFVSPQVWASRPGRAKLLEADYDLLLSIFPFEKDWYAQRAPKLRVEFVGHPMVDRLKTEGGEQKAEGLPLIVLLPGSREAEIRRHWPIMLGAASKILFKAKYLAVFPNQQLLDLARKIGGDGQFVMAEMLVDADSCFNSQVGNLANALEQADAAIASTGTVTMECAFFSVPTVTLYKTSWFNFAIAKRIVTVKWATMPNILADEEVYPEFIQGAAAPENIAKAALELLQDESRRIKIKSQLAGIVSSLGGPGATRRAADAILSLFK